MNLFAAATFSALAAAAFASGAEACPDYTQFGASFAVSGSDLYSPNSFTVTAGGANRLADCGWVEAGYFTSAPDFTFDLSQMQGYRLEIRVVSACDAALVVNSPDGTWYYDDDRNGNLDPAVILNSVSSGDLDVWVGTYDGQYCPATLTLETF